MIYILGLGAGDEDQLTVGVIKKLQSELPIFLRTDQHPMIDFFHKNGLTYHSFDAIYEKHDNFEAVYDEIIATVKQEASKGDIIYATPGHPTVAEYTVKRLVAESETEIVGGQSFLDPMFAGLNIDPIEGLQIMDALAFDYKDINPKMHLIVPQVFDQLVASSLKLDLMEVYDDEHPVCVVQSAGSQLSAFTWKKLYELDRDFRLNNLTTVYVSPKEKLA